LEVRPAPPALHPPDVDAASFVVTIYSVYIITAIGAKASSLWFRPRPEWGRRGPYSLYLEASALTFARNLKKERHDHKNEPHDQYTDPFAALIIKSYGYGTEV
jgi:hypothetical protein